MGSVNEFYSVEEFNLECKWLIDPKHLFVGPKIGEGAHAKVYEGKYKNQNVAIKILHKGETQEEILFIGACKEPIMVIVTELLLGGTLRKYLLKMRPRVSNEQKRLKYVHMAGSVINVYSIHLKIKNLLLTADHKTIKLADFGLAREESLTEMMTAETGTYCWMAPENTRPRADDLPQDVALIVTSCWKEDPNARPNFTQIIQMLQHYLSTILPTKPVLPLRIFTSDTAVLPPESPGTRALMAKRDDSTETPTTPLENTPSGVAERCMTEEHLDAGVGLLDVDNFRMSAHACWSATKGRGNQILKPNKPKEEGEESCSNSWSRDVSMLEFVETDRTGQQH
ncbi:serine/threonine-protein kinase STY13-like [Lycium barbarum]|uniref:serine/threonine-protein kinase STY13-like n=1 Tax=Lycium barbarum TaxID=112863 RepID=UPI00293E3355|nr:serine/threonine-protein kinase STY13-like [Lycium barbarum]